MLSITTPCAQASTDSTDSLGNPFFLVRQRKTIVVVSMVESVRMMEQDKVSVITRWKQFTQRVCRDILPPLGGVLVKSLSYGVMLTFPQANHAVTATQQMRRVMDEVNRATLAVHAKTEAIVLSTGIHSGEAVSDDMDIYCRSSDVSYHPTPQMLDDLSSVLEDMGKYYLEHVRDLLSVYRLNEFETTVSVYVRDQTTTHMIDDFSGVLEDMGKCYLKHVRDVLHVYSLNEFKTTAAVFDYAL